MEKSLQYWWLNANPNIWDLSGLPVGETKSYSLYNDKGNQRHVFRNFQDATVGDIVIGYATSPKKRIVALLEVSAEQDGKNIYFQKKAALKVPVKLKELQARPELADMKHFTCRGVSFVDLTESEYACIMSLIRAKNP